MLTFEPITVDNICKSTEYFKYKISRTSDYTIGAMYMWRDFYQTGFTIYDDMILYKVKFLGRTSFTFPVGGGSLPKAMNAIREYCKENDIPMWFCTVPEEAVGILVRNMAVISPAPLIATGPIICTAPMTWQIWLEEDTADKETTSTNSKNSQ